jgi:predicted small lipoprotein YifL
MFRSLLPTRGRVAAVAAATVLALAGCGDEPETGPSAQDTSPQGQRQQADEEQSGSSTGRTPSRSPATSEPPAPSSPEASLASFIVRAGEVEGPAQITATVDDEVLFTVTADTADEVHVHGYDITVPVESGKPATVRFPADIPGVFEVELEDAHQPLTQLRISQ